MISEIRGIGNHRHACIHARVIHLSVLACACACVVSCDHDYDVWLECLKIGTAYGGNMGVVMGSPLLGWCKDVGSNELVLVCVVDSVATSESLAQPSGFLVGF